MAFSLNPVVIYPLDRLAGVTTLPPPLYPFVIPGVESGDLDGGPFSVRKHGRSTDRERFELLGDVGR